MSVPEEAFARFSDLLDRDRVWQDPALGFRRICRRLGVAPRRFDRFLYGELGFHGEEILAIYRRSCDKLDRPGPFSL